MTDNPSATAAQLAGAVQNLAAAFAHTGTSPRAADAISQALASILGAGPGLAALQGLLQAEAAMGQMYQDAVDHQHKTNILAMATTAKCVRELLYPEKD